MAFVGGDLDFIAACADQMTFLRVTDWQSTFGDRAGLRQAFRSVEWTQRVVLDHIRQCVACRAVAHSGQVN